MRINHTVPVFTEQSINYAKSNGAKLGSIIFVKDRVPKLRSKVLPLQVVGPDDKWKAFTVEPGPDGRYIFRSSHENDGNGLVNVLDTRVVDQHVDAGNIIDEIRSHASSSQVTSFGKYENPSYDGKVFIGIQPYMPYRKGSITEHPNIKDVYLISIVKKPPSPGKIADIDTVLYNSTTDSFEWLNRGDISLEKARKLVEIYKLIKKSKLIQDQYSFQVEFLDSDDFIICQARAFMEKEYVEFNIPNATERLVFGITDPEGIELPVLHSIDCFDHEDSPITHPENWALLKTQHCEDIPLEFQSLNLQAFLISQSFGSGFAPSLEHNHFRIAQEADVTVFEGQEFNQIDDFSRILFGGHSLEKAQEIGRGFRINVAERLGPVEARRMLKESSGLIPVRGRIISNGRTALVEPVL